MSGACLKKKSDGVRPRPAGQTRLTLVTRETPSGGLGRRSIVSVRFSDLGFGLAPLLNFLMLHPSYEVSGYVRYAMLCHATVRVYKSETVPLVVNETHYSLEYTASTRTFIETPF